MALLVGDNTTASYTEGATQFAGGRAWVRLFTATSSGNATALYFYLSTLYVASGVRLLLFNSSGTLLASTSPITGSGWISGSITSTAISSGTQYYLAVVADSYFQPWLTPGNTYDADYFDPYTYAAPGNITPGSLQNASPGFIAIYADGTAGGGSNVSIASYAAAGSGSASGTATKTMSLAGSASGTGLATGNASPNTGSINLSWTASSDPGVTGYYVGVDVASHSGSTSTAYPQVFAVTGTSFVINGLTPGQTYYIGVSSHGAGGHDAYESIVSEISAIAQSGLLSGGATVSGLATGALSATLGISGAAQGGGQASASLSGSSGLHQISGDAYGVGSAIGAISIRFGVSGLASTSSVAQASLSTYPQQTTPQGSRRLLNSFRVYVQEDVPVGAYFDSQLPNDSYVVSGNGAKLSLLGGNIYPVTFSVSGNIVRVTNPTQYVIPAGTEAWLFPGDDVVSGRRSSPEEALRSLIASLARKGIIVDETIQ